MIIELGKRIRELREQKDITLNEFAKRLNVSAGYLSNLETGKTDTISLSLLEQIQKELIVFPSIHDNKMDENISFRLNRAGQQLEDLKSKQPQAAEYLLSTLENGIDWFLKDK